MKHQDDTRHLVKLNEVRALSPQLLSANEVSSARCQCAASAGNVEAVELRKEKLAMQELVGLLLQPPIGTGNHESVRPVRSPFHAASRDCDALFKVVRASRPGGQRFS